MESETNSGWRLRCLLNTTFTKLTYLLMRVRRVLRSIPILSPFLPGHFFCSAGRQWCSLRGAAGAGSASFFLNLLLAPWLSPSARLPGWRKRTGLGPTTLHRQAPGGGGGAERGFTQFTQVQTSALLLYMKLPPSAWRALPLHSRQRVSR